MKSVAIAKKIVSTIVGIGTAKIVELVDGNGDVYARTVSVIYD